MLRVGSKLNSTILKEQAYSEDILQRQIVAKFRAHNAFVIMTDAVGPALKFIADPKKRMGFIYLGQKQGVGKKVFLIC